MTRPDQPEREAVAHVATALGRTSETAPAPERLDALERRVARVEERLARLVAADGDEVAASDTAEG